MRVYHKNDLLFWRIRRVINCRLSGSTLVINSGRVNSDREKKIILFRRMLIFAHHRRPYRDHHSCGCPSGGRQAWDLRPLFVPARTGGNRGDHPELSLGPLGPPFHNMGLCGRPGGDPKAWKHFGPEPDPGMRALHKAPGRRGILEQGLRGGGPGRPPFWRTLVSPVRDWTPVP